jgi:hypothetical protein
MNRVTEIKMDQNLAAGISLIIISLAGFSYVIVTVSLYPEQAIVYRSNLLWLLLQSAVSLFCGILGGYIIGGYKETQRTAGNVDSKSQDSSVQE